MVFIVIFVFFLLIRAGKGGEIDRNRERKRVRE